MKKTYFLFITIIWMNHLSAQTIATPDKIYGDLFKEVQLNRIFADNKTFADAIPKRKPVDIMYDYGIMKGANLNLKKFVEENFILPAATHVAIPVSKNIIEHITQLWKILKHEADKPVEGSSLLPLPNPYIVPGGRFREIYYWDSYFTMLGLKESNEWEMIENMINNFAHLINTYGHIPNGNRTYYLSRSQPPFFSMMVALLAEKKGEMVYKTYLPVLQKEYNYWMEGAPQLKPGIAIKRVVQLNNGTIANRYWDDNATPRQESYKEDTELADAIVNNTMAAVRFKTPEDMKIAADKITATIYHHLRAGAASGWDFSSRWFADGKTLATIQTTNIIPVDLNCLLYELEKNMAKAFAVNKDNKNATLFQQKAANRKAMIQKLFWNNANGFFTDYNMDKNSLEKENTLAGLFPLFCKLATTEQAGAAVKMVQKTFIQPGGVVTTTQQTGQQWDAPNGWAPLQWITIMGLNKYGYTAEAKDIAKRWLALNEKVYAQTGKLMEKYNVMDLNLPAGGGEYPSQDGFGWTNGVYLALDAWLKK